MSSEFKFRALTCEDWKEVTGKNLIYEEGSLKLDVNVKDGDYTTPKALDSGISGCFWHRIVVDADIPDNSTITVSFITSETEEDENSSTYDESITFTKAKDALIQVPPGRYIRLRIDLHREGKESPVLKQVKIYYERLSYLRYLPSIYQDNSESKDFLERFLSIFESSMYDSEELISSLPLFFDPMAAPEEFYHWLADWISLDLYDLLEENQKREFILNAVQFYKKKGTISGLSDLVSLLTGKKCCIKEYKNNVFRSWGMEHDEENELDDDEKVDIPKCVTKAYHHDPACTKFYRRTSRTVYTVDSDDDTHPAKIPGLLTNRGKYCDELHYVTGVSSGKNRQAISYFSNSIGIFVLFPFGEGLQIERHQLRKIIDSFLPVFVRANITYVETTSLEDSYSLDLINDKYSDEVIAPEFEDYSLGLIGDEHSDEAIVPPLEEGNEIQYVKGECTDGLEYWTRFYAYYGPDSPDHPYGRTYSEKNPEYKKFRTVNRKIVSTFSI